MYATRGRNTTNDHEKQLFIPFCHKECCKRSCTQQCSRVWNVCTFDETMLEFNKFVALIRSDVFYDRVCNDTVSLFEKLQIR